MKELFIKESDFNSFLKALMGATSVIGPVQKKEKYVFARLETPEQLRLDYDVTILPPKKAFFPVKQELVRFTENGGESCIAPSKQVLLGVHFYDVKGIDQLDQLFSENYADNNYLANRNETVVVASNIQKVSDRAFYSTVGKEVEPKGHDAFLTKIKGGYLFETRTQKGDDLTTHGAFTPAKPDQTAEAKRVNESALNKCPEKLSASSEEISKTVRNSFKKDALWQELSEKCFSCGTCNIVCPTCYCFNVEDTWNLDQVSGSRHRTWDGCQLHDFSKVSLGGGSSENFRDHHHERYRHRMMRKATYLNETLGGPACVGCGRCSAGCVPDIADPVKIIDRVMEESLEESK